MKTTKNNSITVNKNLVTKSIFEKTIVLDLESGEYYSCNPTSAFILEALQKGQTPDEILDRLTTHFLVSSTTAKPDLLNTLTQFRQFGFIE